MDNEKKVCIMCNENDEQVLMNMFGGNEYICRPCYAEQNEKLQDFKKNKSSLYSECDKIVNGIYLGNEDAAMDKFIFEEKKITAVCVCGSFLLTPFIQNENIRYKKYPIADFPSQSIIQFFDSNFQWMEEMLKEGRNILVHCAAGVSRSASFVIAYLMRKQKISFEKAFDHVKKKRKVISPNSGFLKQLEEYQKQLNQSS